MLNKENRLEPITRTSVMLGSQQPLGANLLCECAHRVEFNWNSRKEWSIPYRNSLISFCIQLYPKDGNVTQRDIQ